MNAYRLIADSHRREFDGDKKGSVDPREQISVTLVLDSDATKQHIMAVGGIASRFGLYQRRQIDGPHAITVTGKASDVQKAFQTELVHYRTADGTCRCRTGPYSVPVAFGSHVLAVLGLDTRPQAQPHIYQHTAQTPAVAYSPLAYANIYGFPNSTGANRSVGIIELGGVYQSASMRWCFQQLKIAGSPRVTCIGTMRNSGATIEVMLDVEIIASIVPAARTVIYFAPNTMAGFYNALAQAVSDKHDAISISWGAPESYFSGASMTAFDNLAKYAIMQGTTICSASGDSGSQDGTPSLAVDFPSSSPYILGCGGTRINAANHTYGGEVVWNDALGATGGGMSSQFAIPPYQTAVNTIVTGNTKRMVPDVSADADPQTGYQVRLGNQTVVVGGTSAAAPLWAALVCRLNAILGRKLGFLHPTLYAKAGTLRQITSGNNGAYAAGSPYNMATGLGSIPANILDILR